MTNQYPTHVTFWQAAKLCLLLLFSPSAFQVIADENAKVRKAAGNDSSALTRAAIIRRAFLFSVCLVTGCGVLGFGIGYGFGISGCASSGVIKCLQIGGTCVLLWGTLFVRGWEVQTLDGVSLPERVNQWLYRFLYCVGTVVLVWSLSWRPC